MNFQLFVLQKLYVFISKSVQDISKIKAVLNSPRWEFYTVKSMIINLTIKIAILKKKLNLLLPNNLSIIKFKKNSKVECKLPTLTHPCKFYKSGW